MKKQSDLTSEVIHRINLHVHNMLQKGQISQNNCNYLTTDIDRMHQFYLVPKIDKDPHNPQGGPIVSDSGRPTEKTFSIGGSFYRTTSATVSILYQGLNPINQYTQ